MTMSLTRFLMSLGVAGTVLCGAGCGTGGTSTGPDAGTGGMTTTTTATGGAGTGGGSSCPGQCVRGPAVGWTFPNLVWFGADPSQAPQCWPEAPLLAFEGHEGLDAPIDCGTCTCTPSTGSCSLPTSMTANAATCAQNGTSTPHTPFDPSSGWNGACDTNESIPSGKLCSGVKCVQSLTIGPLAMTENGCVPSEPPAQSTPTWKTFLRACQSVQHDLCESSGDICIPSSPPGFRVCIYQKGDNDCPSEFTPYAEKHLVAVGYNDTRTCSPCACGAPSGGACSSTVSVYTDGACSTLAYSATVTSSGPDCHDLPSGTPLGSKSATAPTYTPGSCMPSGGEPMGAATLTQPATYCCLPTP
jgi:hypothetical protein